MDVQTGSLRNAPLLETQGDIDHDTCGGLETALRDSLAGGSRIILLDLTEVSYIDSGGLSVLFSALRDLPDDGWLGLIAPNSNVRRLFELVGLLADPDVRIFDDRQAAEIALGEETGAP
ncbi:MAG: STAS domain-containing protein [Thermoleophilia bacterium]|nr:STAS domain-containing protein [Thermoleophilia bacterium]